MKSFDEIYEEIEEEFNKVDELDEEKNNEDKNDSFKKIWNKIKKEFNKIKKDRTSLIIFIIVAVIIFYLCRNIIATIIMFIPLILIIRFFSKAFKNVEKEKARYKEKVVNKLIKNYSNKLFYYPKEGVSFQDYKESTFKYYNSFSSEDLIEGTIANNCRIKMSEIHILDETTDNEGNTKTRTMFLGLFAKITLSHNSNTSFKIQKNETLSDTFKKKDKLDMDSTEFEKIYDVLTEDKISTLRILTSDIMQNLVDFKVKNKVTPEIVLTNDNLYIRLDVGSVFEPKSLNKLDRESIEETYNLINFVFDLVEAFSNNILEFEK